MRTATVPVPREDCKGIVDQPIEIFSAGRHTAMGGQTLSFTEADLAASAAAYDPALHEAPIVVGHPATDAPAYGWVGGLAAAGDRLQATPRQVDAAFAELVRAGRFKKVSASFYAPDSPANPKPGVYYLRHVGFLGAQPPAVKGLKPVSFAAGEEGIVEFADGWTIGIVARVLRGLREAWISRFGQEDADRALPSWEIERLAEQAVLDQREVAEAPRPSFAEPPKEQKDVTTQNGGGAPSARESELQAENERLQSQLASFAEADAQRRRGDDAAFLDGLEREGRLLPANRALASGLLARLDGGEAVSFAEGRAAETPRDALRALLAAQPKSVEFREVAPGGAAAPEGGDPHAVAQAAQRLQDEEARAGRAISFAEAVSRVRATRTQ